MTPMQAHGLVSLVGWLDQNSPRPGPRPRRGLATYLKFQGVFWPAVPAHSEKKKIVMSFTSHLVENPKVDKTAKFVWNQLICMSLLLVFVPIWVVLFEGMSPLKNAWTFGQHFPMNCSKIGHSYEAFTYLCSIYIHIWPKYLHYLLSVNKNSVNPLN